MTEPLSTAGLRLLPWDASGLGLLQSMNTRGQKHHLGGIESEEKLLDRHARYLTYTRPGEVCMFRVALGDCVIGSIGYWEIERDGQAAYEAGWELLPALHGRGIGTSAARLVIAGLAPLAHHPHLFAFPTPDNAGSNGICRRLGFELLGVEDIEYPRGIVSPHHVWRLDLTGRRAP